MRKSCIQKLLCQCKPKLWDGTRNVQLQDGIVLILVTETGQDTGVIDCGDSFVMVVMITDKITVVY
jgi:hypothetical protein